MQVKPLSNYKIHNDTSTLIPLIKQWKSNNESIVFTNGCFDLMHAGHVDYLEKAAQFGDRLIVGLNSDESIQRLKGDTRPLNHFQHRAIVLAALAAIDAVVCFTEDTPLNLIQGVHPNILVKGSDYQLSEIVGAPWVLEQGGQVQRVDFVHQISTSKIIEKIKSNGN